MVQMSNNFFADWHDDGHPLDIYDAWVFDNVYTVLSIWGLALAYKYVQSSEESLPVLPRYQSQQALPMLLFMLLVIVCLQESG
jgi:hypothetical protein